MKSSKKASKLLSGGSVVLEYDIVSCLWLVRQGPNFFAAIGLLVARCGHARNSWACRIQAETEAEHCSLRVVVATCVASYPVLVGGVWGSALT